MRRTTSSVRRTVVADTISRRFLTKGASVASCIFGQAQLADLGVEQLQMPCDFVDAGLLGVFF